MKILSSFTPPHVILNLYGFITSVDYKRYVTYNTLCASYIMVCLYKCYSWHLPKSSIIHDLCISCLVKLVYTWDEVSRLDRTSSVLLADSIRVCVRGEDHFFSMLLRLQQTFLIMQQLADYAIVRFFDKETFNAEHPLANPLHITQRCISFIPLLPIFSFTGRCLTLL